MIKKRSLQSSPRGKNAVFDIHPHGESGWNRPGETVSLRRHLYRRHPVLTSLGALAVILIIVLTADTFLGHANSVYWYPQSCLGGWTNSANAAGAPELSPPAPADDFTADNSAILENSLSQIFCAEFSGEIPADSVPIAATLSISWSFKTVSGPAAVSQSDRPEDGSSGEADPPETAPAAETASSTPEAPPTAGPESQNAPTVNETPTEPPRVDEAPPAPEPAPETAPIVPAEPEPDPAPPAASEPDPAADAGPAAWISHFVRQVFAQETPEPQEDAAAPQEIVTDSATGNGGSEAITGAETTAGAETASSSEEVAEEPEQRDILEVRYSVDGENWQSLGMIGETNWQNARFPVPLTTWNDIKNLQITILSLPVSDVAPIVYLDGVVLTVDHQPSNLPPDPYPWPDPARGDVFLKELSYEGNTAVLVARPTYPVAVVTAATTADTTPTTTDTAATVSTTAPTETPAGDATTTLDVTLTHDSNDIVPVPDDSIIQLWVRDDVSLGWTLIAGEELLAEDPKLRFEYGSIFWIGPDDGTAWRFNPLSKAYESISTSRGAPPTLFFGNEATEPQALIFEDPDQPLHFEEVKTETNEAGAP